MFFGGELPNLPYEFPKGTTAEHENLKLYAELFNRFTNIAITRFNWTGLPDSVSERFLNISLYFYGQAAFFKDTEKGFMAMPCMPAGMYNAYYEPTVVQAFSLNYSKRYGIGEFELIRNNATCSPTMIPVYTYTRRICDVLRTIDVVLLQKKRPYILSCDEKQKTTYKNAFKQVSDNEPLILAAKNFDFASDKVVINTLPSNASLTELWESFYQLKVELYTALGINTPGAEKKERLLSDEVNANNMVIEMSIESQLKEYKEACERINKHYGLNIDVSAKMIADYDMGGDIIGSLYHRITEAD